MRRMTSPGPRGVARSGIVALLCLALGALAVYHFVFQRPGEGALRLIPRDALLAATLDTHPSPQQAALFRRIDTAMARERAGAELNRAISEATRDAPLIREIRPYLGGSFAFALLKPQSTKSLIEWVFLAGATQPGRVTTILDAHMQRRQAADLRYWLLRSPAPASHEARCATMEGSYLVVANQNSNNIVIFKIDLETGHLAPTGQVLEVASPACIKFAKIK